MARRWMVRSWLARRRYGAPPPGASVAGPINGHDILDKVIALPVGTWRYEWDPPHVHHLGPMAQDWHAAFGLGGTDKQIAFTDANGVALVSIQALAHRLEELQQHVIRLEKQLTDLTGPVPTPKEPN